MDKKRGAVSESEPPRRVVGVAGFEESGKQLGELLSSIPDGSGLSFVVLLPLSGEKRTSLLEEARKYGQFTFTEATDEQEIHPNLIVLIPEGCAAKIEARRVKLVRPTDRIQDMDLLFRSLAADIGPAAVGVLGDGTNGDEGRGAQAIREQGGLVLRVGSEHVASPIGNDAATSSTGIDITVSAADVVSVLLRQPVFATGIAPNGLGSDAIDVEHVNSILSHVHRQTGHDFSRYKPTMVMRRISRRMAFSPTQSVGEYVQFLATSEEETHGLFRELLIGVTFFFREPDMYQELLGTLLPGILDTVPDDTTLRVWVPACSSGEEAYSIAMVLDEAINQFYPKRTDYQVFATDIDDVAIAQARTAVYPDGIRAEVTPERIDRYFVQTGGGYQVAKNIRNRIVFSTQNVLQDPPFASLNAISCRNLLIYLDTSVQDDLLQLFHYALVPNGLLILGESESAGRKPSLFAPASEKSKIYHRRDVPYLVPGRYFAGNHPASRAFDFVSRASATSPVSDVKAIARSALISSFAPPSVLVDSDGVIVHTQGSTGRFLEQPEGPPTTKLVEMAKPPLGLEIESLLRSAGNTNIPESKSGILLSGPAGTSAIAVRLSVAPITDHGASYFLVTFEAEDEPEVPNILDTPDISTDTRLEQLERELTATRRLHQASIEQLEASNEDLRSINEELQSANEELESSKEEAQSLNEELNSINGELENKVVALSAAEDDMQNLLNSIDVACVFVDLDRNVRTFSDRATEVFNLIGNDQGRPLKHLSFNITYPDLWNDVGEVIKTLRPIGKEVQSINGTWYQVHVTPYRTVDHRIDGAVIVCLDVQDQKSAQSQIERISQEREIARIITDKIIDSTPYPVFVLDSALYVLSANRAIGDLVGIPPEDLIGRALDELEPVITFSGKRAAPRGQQDLEWYDGAEITFGADSHGVRYRPRIDAVRDASGALARLILTVEEHNGG